MKREAATYNDPVPPGYAAPGADTALIARADGMTAFADEETPAWSGYGACAKCNCKGFEGSAGTCANQGCGHAFQDHW